MATTIAIRFPLGRYHATPWERAVNEGEVEWPPSMWRLARALLATAHGRWPELDQGRLDAVLDALTTVPPAYWTPAISRGHTRHYMPDLNHTSGVPSTDLVLDPYVWVDDGEPLLVRWEVDLGAEEREDLARLCHLVPYLGRSESLVEMTLLEVETEPDNRWWQPGAATYGGVQLLQPEPGITREELEVTTPQLRRRRLPLPPRTALLSYGREVAEPLPTPQSPPEPQVEVIRWRLQTQAPFSFENGILATEYLRTVKLKQAERIMEQLPANLSGKVGDRQVEGGHRHAHWLWLNDDAGRVGDLVLWMPDGDLDSSYAAAMVAQSWFEGYQRWNPKGFVRGKVHVVGLGMAQEVVPELTGPSYDWVSRTPYLPVRHRKRYQTIEEWVRRDLAKECDYRGLPRPSKVVVDQDRQAAVNRYRRYRWDESMRARNDAVWLSIRFDGPVQVSGPVCLGQLSHFGFGMFNPTPPVSPPGSPA